MYSMGSVTPWNKDPKYVIDNYRHGFGHSKKITVIPELMSPRAAKQTWATTKISEIIGKNVLHQVKQQYTTRSHLPKRKQ